MFLYWAKPQPSWENLSGAKGDFQIWNVESLLNWRHSTEAVVGDEIMRITWKEYQPGCYEQMKILSSMCFLDEGAAHFDWFSFFNFLISSDKLQSTSFSTLLEFNMPALTALLRRQSEQNPVASYFNVDILKYQIKSKAGAASCPFQLVSYWKCESTHTDIKIDYKYNSHAMAAPSPLLNVALSVPVDGGVKNVQSKPHSAWLGESNRLVWNFTDISQHSDNNGVGTLRARLEVAAGPSTPATISTQFNSEGTTLSGIEFELVGTGYRLSLVKRRFVSGKFNLFPTTFNALIWITYVFHSFHTHYRQVYMRRRWHTHDDNAHPIECQLTEPVQSIELSG